MALLPHAENFPCKIFLNKSDHPVRKNAQGEFKDYSFSLLINFPDVLYALTALPSMKEGAVVMHVVSAGTRHRDCWSPSSNAFLRYWVGAPRDRGYATKHAAVSQSTTLNAGY